MDVGPMYIRGMVSGSYHLAKTCQPSNLNCTLPVAILGDVWVMLNILSLPDWGGDPRAGVVLPTPQRRLNLFCGYCMRFHSYEILHSDRKAR